MATKVVSSVNPGSAFPQLLRRSRFASFDPTIRQSYGTPPSHLHRGNWGLKRPIPQRNRNAFISLQNFEEHEQYIQWSNAESQVRLINRIEELNVSPKLVPQTPWFIGLGPAAAVPWSLMDSEFCPGESGKYMSTTPSSPPKPSIPAFTSELEGLGRRGKTQYGANQSPKPNFTKSDYGYLHPNLNSMSPKVFKRYLQKLRALRPEFQKFLKQNGVTTSIRETGVPPGNLHIRFLGQHFDKQFHLPPEGDKNTIDHLPPEGDKNTIDHLPPEGDKNTIDHLHPNQPQPIRQQPHRLGGLMYASPTYLESFLTSGVQPAIALEAGSHQTYNSQEEAGSFLVSTAGFISKLDKKRAGPGVEPAFNAGIARSPAALLANQTSGTFIKVRVVDLHLERLPEAVTAFPSSNSSRDVNIRMDLVIHPSPHDHARTNTHPLGSMQYNAPEDSYYHHQQQQPRLSSRSPYLTTGFPKIYDKKNKNLNDGAATGNFERDVALEKLDALTANASSKRPEFAGAMTGMSWHRPLKKRTWRDDQWVERPGDDGGSA